MTLGERVRRIDEAIDARVPRHPVLDACYFGLSSAADHGLLWLALGGFRAARRRSPRIVLRLGVIMGTESALTNGVVKAPFRRGRPTPLEGRTDGPLPYGMHRPITSAFPSGHAASAFTAAMVLSKGSRAGPAYFALAALVATSRVYVRMHHASDVVAGAALGLAFGAGARRLMPLEKPARRALA